MSEVGRREGVIVQRIFIEIKKPKNSRKGRIKAKRSTEEQDNQAEHRETR